MRRSRQFRPLGPMALEQRVALSGVTPLSALATRPESIQVSEPTVSGPIIGNAGNFGGLNIAQTIAAGNPVYLSLTTNFTNESSQLETRLTVPDQANHAITVNSVINLRGGGVEKIQNIEVFNSAGQITNRYITTTLPNGGIQYEVDTLQVQGNKTLEKGTIILPGGSIETMTGTISTSGGQTTTSTATTDPGGLVTRVVSVVTQKNELRFSTKTSTTYPDTTTTTSNSNSSILRMNPPSTGNV